MTNNHRAAFHNNLFALYMEYILSKSNAKKECSDIIGLQNKLFEKGYQLTDIGTVKDDPEVQNILAAMESVDPKSITVDDLNHFIHTRIKNHGVQKQWIDTVLAIKMIIAPLSLL